jgi:TPR repeat protein
MDKKDTVYNTKYPDCEINWDKLKETSDKREDYFKKNNIAVEIPSFINWLKSDNYAQVTKIAEDGDVSMQYHLGTLSDGGRYWNKEGHQCYCQARNWYQKAAAQGHSGAMFELGRLFYNGTCVPQDFDIVDLLFEEAANRGHEDAIERLARFRYERKKQKETQ